jgi:hypothetical protein
LTHGGIRVYAFRRFLILALMAFSGYGVLRLTALCRLRASDVRALFRSLLFPVSQCGVAFSQRRFAASKLCRIRALT